MYIHAIVSGLTKHLSSPRRWSVQHLSFEWQHRSDCRLGYESAINFSHVAMHLFTDRRAALAAAEAAAAMHTQASTRDAALLLVDV